MSESASGGRLPWEGLIESQMELLELRRAVTANQLVDPDRLQRAIDRVDLCREQCAVLGELLITLALSHASRPLQDRLTAVFGQWGVEAYKKATAACGMGGRALEELDAIKTLIRYLEKRVDDLTPGVGQESKTAAKFLELGTRIGKVEAKLRNPAA